MADGSVKIDVGLDITKAEKDLAKLKDKINKAERQLSSDTARKSELEKEIEKAGHSADAAREKIKKLKEEYKNSRGSERASVKERLDAVTANYRDTVKDSERMNKEYQAVNERIERSTQSITEMREQAGAMSREIARAKPGEALANGLEYAKKKMMTFLKYAVGIRSLFILFRRLKSAIKNAVSSFAEHDAETKSTIDGLKSSLEQLKMSWGAAFAPILNAVAPLLQKLIGWLTDAANAISRFIAILSGKSSYKKVISDTGALASNLQDTAGAAAEAKRQLMGFDELNVLDSESTGGGGGGGGAGSGAQVVEENLDDLGNLPIDRLAFAVKDVFFDWSDLTPEQIAEKALAGLLGLGGAIIGGMIGGVPGAMIGLFAGLTLGVLLDSTIFNHDGELSRDELIKTLIDAAGFVAGAAIGFMAGGPLGAMIGATVGLFLAVDLSNNAFTTDGKFDGQKLADRIAELFFGDFKKRVEEWKEVFGNDGAAIAMAVIFGFYNALWDKAVEIWNAVVEVFNFLIDVVKKVLGIHSPSTVFYDIGELIIQGLWNGVSDKWDAFVTFLHGGWDSLKSWWDGLSLGAFHIPVPHFEWTYSQASGLIAQALSFVGLPATIPHLNISWYAKGGIFDAPSLIGVGENGKEAVLPLENNTGWMQMIADELIDRLTQAKFAEQLAEAITSIPRPVMAMGSVVPPNAIKTTANDNNSMLASIMDELRSLRATISSQPIQVDSKIYMDKRQVGQAVTEYQRNNEKARGIR